MTVAVVSRAPLAKIEAFKKRMGWRFKWVSSYGTDFNYDYHVSFTKEEMAKGNVALQLRPERIPERRGPRHQRVLQEREGEIFHTYSSYARGAESLLGGYYFLDIVPKGRDEEKPWTMSWVRHHDRYGA